MSSNSPEMCEPSIETDKLSYEIFSYLESKFLFGYDDKKLWLPKEISPPAVEHQPESLSQPLATDNVLSVIDNQRGKVRILSIDGGGMRGILSGKALAYLEHSLKVKSGNPDARIADYFDVVAGAGIGGIFTSMLFGTKDHQRPIFTADETWKFLVEQGKNFYRSSSNNKNILRRFVKTGSGSTGSTATGLEKVMREVFIDNDRSLTLKDTLKPVLIPCYDLSSTAPFLFSRADALETDNYDFHLWEVCKATSTEPDMFEPIEIKSVDNETRCLAVHGGLGMSNPTAAAITHVLYNKQEFPFVRGVEDLLVLSIGTCQSMKVSYDKKNQKKWKPKEWVRTMARLASDGSADMVDQSVAMAFGQYRSNNYVRIQSDGSRLGRYGANVDTDPSPSNVKMLVGLAEEMLKQKNEESVLFEEKKIVEQSNLEKLDWFAGELVVEHQRRSCIIAPTVSFNQATTSILQ